MLPELIDQRLHADLEKYAKAIDTMTRVRPRCLTSGVTSAFLPSYT